MQSRLHHCDLRSCCCKASPANTSPRKASARKCIHMLLCLPHTVRIFWSPRPLSCRFWWPICTNRIRCIGIWITQWILAWQTLQQVRAYNAFNTNMLIDFPNPQFIIEQKDAFVISDAIESILFLLLHSKHFTSNSSYLYQEK